MNNSKKTLNFKKVVALCATTFLFSLIAIGQDRCGTMEHLKKMIEQDPYAKVFGNIDLLNDPSHFIALVFMDDIYKESIMPQLWDKK